MDATTITRPGGITAIDLLFETWEYLFQQDPQVLKRGVRLPGALALEKNQKQFPAILETTKKKYFRLCISGLGDSVSD